MAIIDVVKYEGDDSSFVWKHPCEDFNIFSQLIVRENQEAIFFNDGEALDSFGPGRYTLKTQNIPLVTSALKLVTGGKSPFHCEIYFINLTDELAIKWGTDSRAQLMEPTYGFPISIGASGEMSIRVSDGRKLIVKLVGTDVDFTHDELKKYFRAFIVMRVKSYLTHLIKTEQISIFELDERLESISTAMKNKLQEDFSDYGLLLDRFLVTKVVRPDGEEQYEKFKELFFRQYADIKDAEIVQQKGIIEAETEAKKIRINAQAMADKRATEGYTYGQERGFDVAEKVAENEASGELTNLGIGLGAMTGVGGTLGAVIGTAVNGAVATTVEPVKTNQMPESSPKEVPNASSQVSVPNEDPEGSQFCDNCGAELMVGALFCDECGTPVSKPADVCKNCGFVFERPGKFCPKCGTKRGE